MSEQHELNGQAPARVSFGPQPWQTIQPEVAAMVLTLWRERNPAQFGAYLAEALTGVKPSPAREPKSL